MTGGDEPPQKAAKTRVSVTMTMPYVEALDRLVEAGVYVGRGEAVKDALRRLFRIYKMKPFYPDSAEGAAGRGTSD